MSDIMKNNYIHDSLVESYFVDCKNRIITLNLLFSGKSNIVKSKLIFKDVLAHDFKYSINFNIIFGIETYEFHQLNKFHKEDLIRIYNHGLPTNISFERQTNDEDKLLTLKSFLEKNNYEIYNIDASLGLCGLVICKDVEIEYLEHIQLKKEN